MTRSWCGGSTMQGASSNSTPGAPALPARAQTAGAPTEMMLAGSDVLVAGAPFDGGRLIGAISLAAESTSFTTLLVTEAVVGPILLALVFGGAFVVGRHAAGPIERARRRQLEFTADASHELRTPLAVIEAETSLALSTLRAGEAGADTIARVGAETRRMRTIVEDLLWLSRFELDAARPCLRTGRPGDRDQRGNASIRRDSRPGGNTTRRSRRRH